MGVRGGEGAGHFFSAPPCFDSANNCFPNDDSSYQVTPFLLFQLRFQQPFDRKEFGLLG